jgi:RHS repeat-associated protein
VVWAQAYDPFGRVVSGAGNDAGFAGQWFAQETGLHQNWMRDYDATLGRYIQPDPLGLMDGASVYLKALESLARCNCERYRLDWLRQSWLGRSSLSHHLGPLRESLQFAP